MIGVPANLTYARGIYLWHKTTRTTSQSGFCGNAEGVKQDKAVKQTYAKSLQQFANVNEHNTSTFNNLMASNMQMLNNISPTLQALQEKINGLALAVQAKRSPSPAPLVAAPIYQAPPTPRYQAPPQQHFQAPFQPPYQQQGQWTNNGQGRGRMSNRGRGRG